VPRVRLPAAVSLLALALLAPQAAAGAERPFGLSADCSFSHRAPDDPILYPREPGASHSHDFFGNRSTDARSTPEGLRRRATTCDVEADRSAYWVPTLRHRGRSVKPRRARFYYVAVAADPTSVQPLPEGLRVIAGNETERSSARSPRFAWTCSGTNAFDFARIPRCRRGSRLVLRLRFPDCWDGRSTDSPDHRSHMAYGGGSGCPASHPVPVPQLRFEIRYPVRGGRATRLSSGPTWTTHGDFMNAWDPGEFEQRLRACVADESCVDEGGSYARARAPVRPARAPHGTLLCGLRARR
jgi:Domain of unknown function (DUF1996)